MSNDEQIKYMVNRFLGWKLPDDFNPDGGIRFTPLNHPNHWPIGTNLLDATQATAMAKYLVEGFPQERVIDLSDAPSTEIKELT